MNYHLTSAQEALDSLGVRADEGLSEAEARHRLSVGGENVLEEAPKKPFAKRLLEQFADPMVVILLIAAALSGGLGDVAEMAIIFAVVGINAVLGIVQENKAEAAIEALSKMSVSMAKARRGGEVRQVPSSQLVAGDVVLFEAGDSIPADLRLLETASLKVEEAALTGESVPSEKSEGALSGEVQLGDRSNMAYMGTSVVYGRGAGVVVKTGMGTEMGKIAGALAQHAEEKTPLQRKLGEFSKTLSFVILGICAAIFAVGFARYGTEQLFDTFMSAVALAVAAIPEGLVVIVTVLLAIGVKNMAERNAIVRRLTAVETLGCAGVICSDKTGTLTQNKMTVTAHFGDTRKLREAMFNCNDSEGDVGDPTEIALEEFGRGAAALPRVGEAPFDSDRKLMSTVHKLPGGGYVQYTKGAPDELLKRCSRVDVSNTSDNELPLSDGVMAVIRNANKDMAGNALRVLAGAMRLHGSAPQDLSPEAIERDLVFIGLCGMIDPVRPEARDAIKECHAAGITVVMITGDHKDTAVAIANDLGITASAAAQALTGAELSKIPDSGFDVDKYRVYARVQPEHKVRIVNAWRAKGQIVAMTGDGVNDAPAIKAAGIGIGMGITGTDVTKNVADMVLADDNFATIVAAVKEGRRIYENIRKAVVYLMSTNVGEVLCVFVASLAGFHILAPIHLLWINLVTDTFPAIALGMEGAEADAMRKPPRDAAEGIFANGMGAVTCIQGIAVAGVALAAYFIGSAVSAEYAVTMAFVTLSCCEALHAFNLRSRVRSVFGTRRQNWILWGAAALGLSLTFCAVYLPGVNGLFRLHPLAGADLLAALGLAALIIPVSEAVKLCMWLLGGRGARAAAGRGRSPSR